MLRDRAYLDSFQETPCIFCEYPTSVGHHLKLKGVCGTGLKAPDYLTIPCCGVCHDNAHNGSINQQVQIDAFFRHCVNQLSIRFGEGEAINKMGEAFWRIYTGD